MVASLEPDRVVLEPELKEEGSPEPELHQEVLEQEVAQEHREVLAARDSLLYILVKALLDKAVAVTIRVSCITAARPGKMLVHTTVHALMVFGDNTIAHSCVISIPISHKAAS